MTSAQPCEIPSLALLRQYDGAKGYADCYVVDIAAPISQAEFIEAFYTSSLFKVERAILKWFARRPSSDLDAKQLAAGAVTAFAAWTVEAQSSSQLLLADFTGRTRSWLMALAQDEKSDSSSTRLYFGSAVVPKTSRNTGAPTKGILFVALLGFHRLYSRMLLNAAKSQLVRNRRNRICADGRSSR